MISKKIVACWLLLIAAKSYAQDKSEYTLSVQAKISNQGSGKPPAFSDWKDYPTRTLATLSGYKPQKDIKLSSYGGRLDQKTTATGFFHVSKVNGRWWSVDPEGYLFIHKGVNDIRSGESEQNEKVFQEKFNSSGGWAQQTNVLLHELGFNGAGAWSDYKLLNKASVNQKPLAYTVILDFMGTYGRSRGAYQQSGHLGYPDNTIFVFDPGFEKFCNEYAKQITVNAQDKNLFGYFSDNELPFYRKTLDNFLSKKDTTDAGYLAAENWLKEQHITQSAITDADRNRFLGLVADRYFAIVSKAIRKYDPNHMYIGCRFSAYEKNVKEVLQAGGKYLDIISINYYNQWTPQNGQMENWTKWSGKPFLISEWYVKAEDSGMGNYAGAGWVVQTQQDRGLFYQNYALGLLESANCVGWHWFKYQDNDPANKNVDPSNTDANKGMLNTNYELYKGLTEQMKILNDQVYSLIDFFDQRKNKPD